MVPAFYSELCFLGELEAGTNSVFKKRLTLSSPFFNILSGFTTAVTDNWGTSRCSSVGSFSFSEWHPHLQFCLPKDCSHYTWVWHCLGKAMFVLCLYLYWSMIWFAPTRKENAEVGYMYGLMQAEWMEVACFCVTDFSLESITWKGK